MGSNPTPSVLITNQEISDLVRVSKKDWYEKVLRSLPFAILFGWLKLNNPFGGVVEWFKALVLKTNESRLNKIFKILQKH